MHACICTVCICMHVCMSYTCMNARDISLWAPCQRICLLRCDVDLLMIFAASGTKCTSNQKKETAAWLSYWTELGAMILQSVRQMWTFLSFFYEMWSFQLNLFSFPPLALRSFCASLLFGTRQVNATSGSSQRTEVLWNGQSLVSWSMVQLRNCFTDPPDFCSAECRLRKKS